MSSGKLTALKAKALTRPGRYGDGGGLWLQVRDGQHRSWLFRFSLHERPRQMGLGPYPDVSLADAREAARLARAKVRQGVDPIDERNAERDKAKAAAHDTARALTFRGVADRYIAAHEATWRNEKHKYQWRSTLEVACREIGDMRVASVATGDVMRVLDPIWREKTETASRLRGRIESVLDYAAVRGWRAAENPARWKGHLAKLLPAPGKVTTVGHHNALPWSEIGAFMMELRGQEGVAARALEWTILTAARTGETIGTTWSEIDLHAALWTVPASRMKARREHRVPLSAASLNILKALGPSRDDGAGGWVFPGGRSGKPLSNMSMIMLLRRMQRADLTVHGFRSTFRDWSAETTDHPREVAEQALAHVLGDKVEAAYRRGDLFEKRRRLMDDWAYFCCGAAMTAEVVVLRERRPVNLPGGARHAGP